MDWQITTALAILSFAVFAFAGWRRAKPSVPTKVRMAPWLAIQAIAAACLFMLIVHEVNLAGFETGNRQAPGASMGLN